MLDLIAQLPSDSRYHEALTNHPKYAEQLARLPEPEEPWAPRQAEFGLAENLLANISDQIQQLTHLWMRSNGGNPGQLKPFPRPKSLVDEAREQAELEWAKDFIQRLGFDPDDI